jgi:hypothetical protein
VDFEFRVGWATNLFDGKLYLTSAASFTEVLLLLMSPVMFVFCVSEVTFLTNVYLAIAAVIVVEIVKKEFKSIMEGKGSVGKPRRR